MYVSDLEQFHFLRPHFLWLLLPSALACWGLARTILNSGQLQKIIDADLLPHLLLRGGARRPWLFALIFALLAGMIVALAGPTWRKLPTPVYSSQDALVILLDLSPSMMATDLSPNRLTRARLKVLDILRQRKDGLTALVGYGGEAHVVTPLTEDTATIANLVPALSPSIVPVPGSNTEMAVETGIRLLKDGAAGQGQLLAVTDGIDEMAVDTVAKLLRDAKVELNILAVGSGEGSPIPRGNGSGFVTDSDGSIIIANFDAGELSRLARGSGGRFAKISVDDSDIAHLLPESEAPEQAQLTEREFDQWSEEGPWLVLLLLPLAALLFRRGALACTVPFTLLLLPPQQSQAFEWQDLWQRQDQQAQQLLQDGQAEQAAKTFRNPQWRGTANYRAGDFPAAEEDFARSPDAQGLYNLGNSLTRQGLYNEAIAAYDEALKKRPQFADAEHNREIAEKLKKLQEQQQQQQQQSQQNQQQSGDQQQQQSGSDQQQQQNQDQQQQDQQGSGSQTGTSGSENQEPSEQEPQNGEQREQQAQQQPGEAMDGEEQQGEQPQAGAEESPLDPETQQALDQWLRQIPDDPAGLMREKFKYESLQRRRAYRSGEWRPPENGATQRW
ncbi:Ca-activated chloride channel family protein [Microbulbifer donghaiensis]|uniref:Ca-activated chloride channel family protein n=1 Tax=Microbulbifer donghaiensis TaxID=494016 RepID=A0A1M4TZK0_9GAMM|nr:VWA domain-containing protein [Microbulbifer donghaiensis]SHE49879.1 Ca-activated chloride channel family protein [Microbulbifer donghaiensis]